jgi:hypothetical protein
MLITRRKRIAEVTFRTIAYVVIPGALAVLAFAATLALK